MALFKLTASGRPHADRYGLMISLEIWESHRKGFEARAGTKAGSRSALPLPASIMRLLTGGNNPSMRQRLHF